MKQSIVRKIIFFFIFVIVNLTACSLDYSNRANWVICDDNTINNEQHFDVFYVYPTLVADKENPLMDWSQSDVAEKTKRFVSAQTGILSKNARIFAPYVRQLEYSRCIDDIRQRKDIESTLIKQGIDDTYDAFLYYMKHYNNGRPFVLFGHSQGAIDIYYLLKNNKDISIDKGFVVAYPIGLPYFTYTMLDNDFIGRDISYAQKSDDIGVIATWNTQNKEAQDSLFSCKNSLCINPLNWRTDETVACNTENKCAIFYDYISKTEKRIPHFCGAVIDINKGALIVDLPSISEYDGNGFMGKGIFHINDIWFFGENIRENAMLRVQMWLEKYGQLKK